MKKVEEGKKPIRVINEKIEKNPIRKSKQLRNKNNKRYYILLIPLVIFIIFAFYIFFYTPNIETVKNSVVMIKIYDEDNKEIATGSGFCVYNSNYIVTNYHVISGAKKITILTDDAKEYSVDNILIFNQNYDLAILESSVELTPLKIGNYSNLRAGDNITTIGSPQGQLNTVSTGVISNADDNYEIRITAPISPGSSGGVLLNKKNEIIGVTFASYNSESAQNINYAINAQYLDEMYDALISGNYNNITYSNYSEYIGISFKDIDWMKNLSTDNNFGNKYFRPSSIETHYDTTNFNNRLSYFLRNYDSGWYQIYKNLSKDEKNEVSSLLIELKTKYKEKSSSNLKNRIKDWNVTDFFMNLFILKDYQYAITIVDLDNYSTKNEYYSRINDYYPLSAAEKTLILYLIADIDWYDISDTNKKDIFKYFDSEYNTEDLGALLEILGYEVVYKKDGTLTAYW